MPQIRPNTIRRYILRYDLKVVVDPSEDAANTLPEAVKEILSKLKQVDTTLFIAPYKKENEQLSCIYRTATSPKNTSGHEKKCRYDSENERGRMFRESFDWALEINA